jgi:hypothetical protein
MIKEYTINMKKRIGGLNGYYFTWALIEHGKDKNDIYQYVKVIADFGNTKRKENYQNAKKLKLLLEKENKSCNR